MNEWNIQARSRGCQACGRVFSDRESYHTLLFEQRSGLERVDVCGACWDEQHRHGAKEKKGFISHWQGTFSVPPPPPPEAIRKDSAEALLRRLVERRDPAWQPATFILAVMLERKKVLKTRETLRAGGRRTFVYEIPKTGEVFTVVDPGLQLNQLEQVQHDVARLLEQGLPDEPAAEAVTDSGPSEEPFVPEMPPEVVDQGLMAEGAAAEVPEVEAAPEEARTEPVAGIPSGGPA